MRHNPIAGAAYFLRGFGLILRPRVLPFVVVPLAINVCIFVVGFWLGWDHVEAFADRHLPEWEWLRALVYPVFLLAAAIIAFFTFTMIGNLVAAPFNGLLAEAVERDLTGRGPVGEAGWRRMMRDVADSIASELRKLGYIAMRGVPLLLLFLVPGLNAVAPFVWMIFSAWMLAISYVDYPMANHGLTFPEQRRRLAERRFLGLGFGAAVMVALMIPLVNLLVIPCAVAGATRLWVERLAELGAPGDASA